MPALTSELTPSLTRPTSGRSIINPNLPDHDLTARAGHGRRRPSRLPPGARLALFVATVYGVCCMLACGSVVFTLRSFAQEGGVSGSIFLAAPALLATLFALLVYQDAQNKVKGIADSVSRGLVVGVLTWVSLSALSTWIWCLPENYASCYGNFLLASGLVIGGPLLAAALTAGALVGWFIGHKSLGSLFG